MGCDIHAHVEVKVKGVWEHYNIPDIGRDYDLFSRMAGVRGDSGVEPKGLPKKLSFITKYDRKRWGVDGHSDSWLSAKEVSALCDYLEARTKKENPKQYYYAEKVFGWLFGSGWDFWKYPQQERDFEDARLVFWFDN